MKMKDLILKVNDIKNKLNKEGHELNRVVITDENGAIKTSSNVSTDELDTLQGIRDNIQSQIDTKLVKDGYSEDKVVITNESGEITASDVSSEKIEYLRNVNEDIQSQIDTIDEVITETLLPMKDLVDETAIELDNVKKTVESHTEDISSIAETLAGISEEANKISTIEEEIAENKKNIADSVRNIASNKSDIETLKALIGTGDDEGNSSIGVIDLLNPFLYIVDNTKEEGAYTDIVIQEAINKAKVNGGGVVFVPFGEYLLQNELFICSNIINYT